MSRCPASWPRRSRRTCLITPDATGSPRGVKEPALRESLRVVSRPLLHAEHLAAPDLGLDVAAPLPADYAAARAAAA